MLHMADRNQTVWYLKPGKFLWYRSNACIIERGLSLNSRFTKPFSTNTVYQGGWFTPVNLESETLQIRLIATIV